jgi:hypothetical protein
MFPEPIIATFVSLLVGSLLPLLREIVKDLRKNSKGDRLFESPIGRIVLRALNLDKAPDSPELLFAELSETSGRMDKIVSRIQAYTKMRESAVAKLETQLGQLSQEEGQVRKTIDELQHVPLPAAEYFASLVNRDSKRGALRDYVLFVAGVVVSGIVTIALKHFGLA